MSIKQGLTSISLENLRHTRYSWAGKTYPAREGYNEVFRDFLEDAGLSLRGYRLSDWEDMSIRWNAVSRALDAGKLHVIANGQGGFLLVKGGA